MNKDENNNALKEENSIENLDYEKILSQPSPPIATLTFGLFSCIWLLPQMARISAVSLLLYFLFIFSFFIFIIMGFVFMRNKGKFWDRYLKWNTNIYYAFLGGIPIVFENEAIGLYILAVCIPPTILAHFIFNYFVLKKPDYKQKRIESMQKRWVIIPENSQEKVLDIYLLQFISMSLFYVSLYIALRYIIGITGIQYQKTLLLILPSFIIFIGLAEIANNRLLKLLVSFEKVPGQQKEIRTLDCPRWLDCMILQYAFLLVVFMFISMIN